MKKIISTVSAAVLLLVVVGCEKNFDPKIYGVLTDQNYPSCEKDYETLMMTCYTPFMTPFVYCLYATDMNQHGWYAPSGGVVFQFDITADTMAPWVTGVWNNNIRQISEANYNLAVYWPRNMMSDETPSHYPKTREVTRFTEIIGNIEKAPADRISLEKKNEFLGEARLCRGLHMFFLLHVYGPVPVIVDPAKVNDSEALKNAERPTLDEYCDWVYDDLAFAIENISETQAEHGRFTADYARYCLMRHCLNEGYHKDGWYDKALEMYSALNTGRYKLFDKGTNPYVDMFREANDWNSEIIMAVSCSTSSTGGQKEGSMNSFFMSAAPFNCTKKDDLGNPTPFAVSGPGWGLCRNIAPKFYDTFETDDLRKEAILTSYYTTSGEWWGPADIGKHAEWDGYIPYKYPAETATAPCWGNDIPMARWADVLLMFAEAEVRKTGAAPSEEAKAAVNAVRARAGLGELQPKYVDSAAHFLDAVLEERGHEFWYEGVRKIDLIRFNKYAQNCRKVKLKIPTHQYMPIPNYAVDEATAVGKTLEQTYSREGWEADLAAAKAL